MDQLRHFGIKTRMIRGDTNSYNKETHIIYQDEDGQIYTSPKSGYDIVTHGSNQKEKYARLLKKLENITKQKVKTSTRTK